MSSVPSKPVSVRSWPTRATAGSTRTYVLPQISYRCFPSQLLTILVSLSTSEYCITDFSTDGQAIKPIPQKKLAIRLTAATAEEVIPDLIIGDTIAQAQCTFSTGQYIKDSYDFLSELDAVLQEDFVPACVERMAQFIQAADAVIEQS